MRRPLLGLAVLAVLAGTSVAAHPADLTAVRSACAALGLNRSEAPFAYCVRSLEQSAPARRHGAPAAVTAVGGAYTPEDACAAIGLDPATARFSYCVGNLKQTLFDEQNVLAR